MFFFQTGLRKLPKMWGIEYEKTWFRHLFNKPENRHYVEPIPGREATVWVH